jgi:parallel beta-helix repeat protein
MKKPLLTLLFIVALLLSAFAGTGHLETVHAATDVNGIISSDTTWTKAGGPYELKGPVAVNQGVTLTIEAGTTINLNTHYIQVNGTLRARGTEAERIIFNVGQIVFTSVSSGWNEQSGSGCIIEKSNFTSGYHGDTLITGDVTIEGASPKVASCDIGSVDVAGGSPVISKNVIENINLNGTPQVSENTIEQLHINGGKPVISSNTISHITSSGDSASIIQNNHISYSPRGEMGQESPIIRLSGEATVCNNYITGLVTPSGPDPISYGLRTIGPFYTFYGIEVSGNALISNNIISGCTEASIVVSGGNPTIQNNTLNDKGIILKSASTINYNNIQGGITLSQSVTANVDATNNWWGTTDTSTIDKLIFDFNDDFNLGKVNYMPFLAKTNPNAHPTNSLIKPTPSPSPIPLSPTPAPTPTLTPDQTSSPSPEPKQTEFIAIIGATILAIIVGAGLGLLVFKIRRK